MRSVSRCARSALIVTLEERFRAFGPAQANRRRGDDRLLGRGDGALDRLGPGCWVDRDGVITALLPGVPSEMRRMWTRQVRPRLAAHFALAARHPHGEGLRHRRIRDGRRLGGVLIQPPDGVEPTLCPGRRGPRPLLHSRWAVTLGACSSSRSALGDHVYGTDDEDLAVGRPRPTRRPRNARALPGGGRLWARSSRSSRRRSGGRAARYLGGVLDVGGSGDRRSATRCSEMSSTRMRVGAAVCRWPSAVRRARRP